jgi:hypothetical protein
VEFRYGVYADADTVRAEHPDVVIVATGGLPNREFLSIGRDLVLDTWDVMSGDVHTEGVVVVYDDNGAEQALDAAELPTAVVSRPRSRASTPTQRWSVTPTTSWSSTAPCPTTSCTSISSRSRATAVP